MQENVVNKLQHFEDCLHYVVKMHKAINFDLSMSE